MKRRAVVLIVAFEGYQPVEYEETKQALGAAGFDIVNASNKAGIAKSSECRSCLEKHQEIVIDKVIKDIDPECYAGIFLIGGPGALDNLDNETTYFVLRRAAAQGVPFGAICVAPRILAHAGVLQGKNATGWDEDKELAAIFNKHGVNYVHQPVVVDGMIVTAVGPKAAKEFGDAIAQVISGK